MSGLTIEETVEGVLALREQGLEAIRPRARSPACRRSTGTGESVDQAKGGLIHTLPKEEVWATHKYLPLVPKLFEKVSTPSAGTFTCCTTCTTA